MWCKECFDAGDHEGHIYTSSHNLGVCDCGDSDNVKEEGFCKHHKGQELELQEIPDLIDKAQRIRIEKVFLSYLFHFF